MKETLTAMLQKNAKLAISGLMLVAVGALTLAAASHAGERFRKTIRSCSAYGNGCITAPVRKGRFGPETRLPSGTWIDCRGDCREAIREEVLDFWETQSDKAQIIRR
jgi:hypothetical protein